MEHLDPSKAHTVYQVEVRARNSYGWSPVSRLHTFFTPSVSSAELVKLLELPGGLLVLVVTLYSK